MLGVLALAALVILIVAIVVVVASALLALAGALVAMAAARLWAPGSRLSYRDAYKGCAAATFVWLAIAGVIGVSAVAWSNDSPKVIEGLVQSIHYHFELACKWLLGHFDSMLPAKVQDAIRLPPDGVSEKMAAPARTAAIAILVLPALLAGALALGAAGPPYRGWLGYVRSCLTLPLVLALELPLLLYAIALLIRYTV